MILLLHLQVLRGMRQGKASDNEEILRVHTFLFQLLTTFILFYFSK